MKQSKELYRLANNYRKILSDKLPPGSIIPAHTDQGHYYRVGDNTYSSVTGALAILKDPSIQNWKMNQAVDYVLANLNSGKEIVTLLAESKSVPEVELENASSIGRKIHDERQRVFQEWINTGDLPSIWWEPTSDPRLVSAIRALYKFVEETGYEPVATEVLVWSDKLKLAGQLDDLGIIDGKLVLLDLKSSNSISNKVHYFYQVALYAYMLKERTGIVPDEYMILRVDKYNGTYEIKKIKNIRRVIGYAKAVLKLNEGDKFVRGLLERKKIKL